MNRNGLATFEGGAVIGALGGLIGLGGAEFRLPLLIGPFRFAAQEAVILNILAGFAIGIVASLLGGAGVNCSFPRWCCCSASTSSWRSACRP